MFMGFEGDGKDWIILLEESIIRCCYWIKWLILFVNLYECFFWLINFVSKYKCFYIIVIINLCFLFYIGYICVF